MNVAVVAPSPVPFVSGGAERAWSGLVRTIADHTGLDAELIKIPVDERTLPGVVAGYEAFAALDLDHFDAVITGKYPAWMLAHPNHIVYMLHPLRGLYDMYHLTGNPPLLDTGDRAIVALQALMRRRPGREALPEFFGRFHDLAAGREAWPTGQSGGSDELDEPGGRDLRIHGPLAREIVHFLDGVALRPPAVRRYAAISRTVAARADYFPDGVHVEAIHHPSEHGDWRCGRDDYLFTASRIELPKRIDLIVAAMAHVPGNMRLRVAGTGPDRDRCEALAAHDSRIEFLGPVSLERLRGLYADALAVAFVPLEEDLGLITMEAMASAKPVVTCHDSGGPTEIVVDGETGFVVDPTPVAVGAALTRLASDRALARSMGVAGRSAVASVTWLNVVRRLLGPELRAHRAAGPPRRAGSSRSAGTQGPAAAPGPVYSSAAAVVPLNRARDSGRPVVVVLSTFPIHPRAGGGQLRAAHLYGSLTGDYDVIAVSLSRFGDGPREVVISPGFTEVVVPRSQEHEGEELAIAQQVGVPVTDIVASVLIGKTPEYGRELARACSRARIAILCHPYLKPALDAAAPNLPFIYDAHNAEVELKRGMLPDDQIGRSLLTMVRAVEGDAIRDAGAISVCSANDLELLAAAYPIDRGRVVQLPNGVDTAAVRYSGAADRRASAGFLRRLGVEAIDQAAHSALFMGSFHPPNVIAARRLIELAPTMPDVVFLLVGSHCDAFQLEALPGNVVCLGPVSEFTKNSLLRHADIGLNPMVTGSGTNLKLVEYFAAGLPAASTDIGMRGLEVELYGHLWPLRWGNLGSGIRTALANPRRAALMAARARGYVESELDWKIIGARLSELVARVASG